MVDPAPGTRVALAGVEAPALFGAGAATVRRILGAGPHGKWALAEAGGRPLLLSFLDPQLVATPTVATTIESSLARAATITNKNLLPLLGAVPWEDSRVLVWQDPGGPSMRDHLARMLARGKTFDAERVRTIAAHASRALGALHRVMPHGFVSLDTIFLSRTGRVFVGECGVGAVLPLSPQFERFRLSGLLPAAPECVQGAPAGVRSDVYALAACCVELLTGQCVQAGATTHLQALSDAVGPAVYDALTRALAPDPDHRFASMRALRQALRGGPTGARAIPSATSGRDVSGKASAPPASLRATLAYQPRSARTPPVGDLRATMAYGAPAAGAATGPSGPAFAPHPSRGPGRALLEAATAPPPTASAPGSPRPHLPAGPPASGMPTLPPGGRAPAAGAHIFPAAPHSPGPPPFGGTATPSDQDAPVSAGFGGPAPMAPLLGYTAPALHDAPGTARTPRPAARPPFPTAPPEQAHATLLARTDPRAPPPGPPATASGRSGFMDLAEALDPDSGLLNLTDLDGTHVEPAMSVPDEPKSAPPPPPPPSDPTPEPSPEEGSERFVIVRNGMDHGPFTLDRLLAFIGAGELSGADTLRPIDSNEPRLVADVPALREACLAMTRRRDATPAPGPAPTPAANPPSRGPLWWIAAVLVLFAAGAGLLYLRYGGPP